MAYPTPGDYQDALQFPDEAFADPVLAAGTVEAGPLGLPRPITGAFAAVFPVETTEGRVAVRCFLTEVPAQQRRYRAIAKALEEAALPYTVGFDYQPAGVRVDGTPYPLVRMDWAEGETLGAWVARHHAEADRMRALAEAWRRMLADLNAHGLAHGDLQHGNVLVRETAEGPRLTLVDYDAFVVPSLYGAPAPEVGHRNYQHPDRTDRDAGPYLDRFPGLVIYTALLALAHEPALWDRYVTGENLLFVSDDVFAPDASPLFANLRRIDAVRPLAEALRTACFLPLERMPTLDAALAGAMPEAKVRARSRADREAPSVRRTPFERAFLPAFLLGGVLVVLLALIGSARLGMIAGVGALAVAGGMARVAYLRHSVVRRRRRLAREAEVLARWADDLDAEARDLDAEQARVRGGSAEARAARLAELRAEALGRHLRRHFVGELAGVEGAGHRVVVRLKATGIRDAEMAKPERVAEVLHIGPSHREAIAAWRDGLLERYAGQAPDRLSPSEEQRLRRHRQRQLDAIDRERARLQTKAAVQRDERAHLLVQREALPAFGFLAYLGYLLRMRRLPAAKGSPPRQDTRSAADRSGRASRWWADV